MGGGKPTHLVIPDTQNRKGVPVDHLVALGQFILEKRPDVIVHLGDLRDFPSLSGWESGIQKVTNNRDVLEDCEAGDEALELITGPFKEWNRTQNHRRRYKPRLVLLRGNHDYRLNRWLTEEPWVAGLVANQCQDEKRGWEVVPFLRPITIDGVTYCHFVPRSGDGKIKQSRRGAPSARLQAIREARSCTAGHQQGLSVHRQMTGGGVTRSIIAGSFYMHTEAYLTDQGQHHWQGVLLKHQVSDGNYDLCEVSLDYLLRKYG